MKLSDLSDTNRRILVVLKDIHCGGRRHIADLAGLQPNQVSPALNRLDVMGFIDRPSEPGAGWTMSQAGYALFGLRPPAAAEPDPESEPEEELIELIPEELISNHEPESAPVAVPPAPSKSADIMDAMEIELALEQVCSRLRAKVITARAARVYREILAELPVVLANELSTITAMVDAHG